MVWQLKPKVYKFAKIFNEISSEVEYKFTINLYYLPTTLIYFEFNKPNDIFIL